MWAGTLAGAPGPRLRVLGTGGAFVVDDLDRQEDALRAGRALPLAAEDDRGCRLVHGAVVEPVEAEPGRWDVFYPQMAAAVRGDGAVPVDPADAVDVLRVLEGARTSAADRAVVRLTV